MSRVKTLIPVNELSLRDHGLAFADLGFPVGFDESQILVDLQKINQIRSIGGMGYIAVRGKQGDSEQFTTGINSVDSSGAATAGLSKLKKKNPILSDVEIFDEHCEYKQSPEFYEPDIRIWLNNNERTERLEKKSPRGQFDVDYQAKLLNEALKKGLSRSAMMRWLGCNTNLELGIVTMSLGVAAADDIHKIIFEEGIVFPKLAIPLTIWTSISMLNACVGRLRGLENSKISSVSGLDRCLGAQALSKTATLITPDSNT